MGIGTCEYFIVSAGMALALSKFMDEVADLQRVIIRPRPEVRG